VNEPSRAGVVTPAGTGRVGNPEDTMRIDVQRALWPVLALTLLLPGAAGAAEERTFSPTGTAAARYGPDGGARCNSTALSRQLGDEVEQLGKGGKLPAPVADPALCGVAESLLGWNEKTMGGPPRKALLAMASQFFGRVTAPRQVIILQHETETRSEIIDRLLPHLQDLAEHSRTPRYGLAVQRLRKDQVRTVLVLGEAPVALQPLPRRLEPGQAAPLVGALADPAPRAVAVVSDAHGALTKVEGQGPEVKAEVRCTVPGITLVEVRALRGDESSTVASFPVGCGVDLPASGPLAAPAWPATAAEQERKALAMVNAERSAVGLAPLTWDDGVAGAARQVAEALRDGRMADTDVVGKLKQAGIVSLVVLQSAAADRNIGGAHEMLLSSPSNRANLFSAEVNLAGVAVVAGKDPNGEPMAYLTEVMVKELQAVDPVAAREELRQALLAKRRAAKASEVVTDPKLDEVAQKFAEADAAAGGGLARARQNEILAPVNDGFRQVTFLFGAKSDPLAILADPDVLGEGKVIGVGLAQGVSPSLGKNTIFPCILLGVSRSDPGPKPTAKPEKKPAAKPAPAPAPKKDAK
jgi:uncharacterized protein YkwD